MTFKFIYRKNYCVLFFFLFISCGIKTFKLKNSITEVPSDSNVYLNKSKYIKSLNNIIDTSSVYEEYDVFNRSLERLNKQDPHCCYSVLKFYGNGLLNYFVLDKDNLLNVEDFNPENNGYRGVYYEDNGSVRIDLFIIVDQFRNIGKLSGNISIENDTLYLKTDKHSSVRKFIKNNKIVPKEFLKFKVNW